ncbi:MAG: twin-arginine translocase subunit TatC [Deltaproteobacteria bacterium]|jgi:sec-independent protein translocase protein TatC|nr:twin-arginine translocase subunit TatC [Deltaproteobacteria bacterium]
MDMSFLDHLRELRRRLLISVIALAIAFLAAWPWAGEIIDLLLKPILRFLPPGEGLKFFALPDAFAMNLKISLWTGFLVSSPITLWQLWAFCAPGLHAKERKKVPVLAGLAFLLLVLGAAFAYFAVWPITFGFFLGFSSDTLSPLLAADSYLSLALGLVLVFALTFQLPLVLMFLGYIGLINSQKLKKFRPYAVIVFFVIGAVLTPPDALSQCFLALTLLFLYELSIFLMGRPKPLPDGDPPEPGDGPAAEEGPAPASPEASSAESGPAAARSAPPDPASAASPDPLAAAPDPPAAAPDPLAASPDPPAAAARPDPDLAAGKSESD